MAQVLVFGLSLWIHGISHGSVDVEFSVDKAALETSFSQTTSIFPVIIPPLLHIHSSNTCLIFAVATIMK
jgi:hypothetical protein